jgi:hypothetical protein
MITIKFETNFNNKVYSDCFVHISLAPKYTIAEHKLLDPINIIIVDNPSLIVNVKLIDMCRLTLPQLLNIHTLPSHGLYYYDFVEWWQLKYPSKNSATTPLAVYYFKRI